MTSSWSWFESTGCFLVPNFVVGGDTAASLPSGECTEVGQASAA
jgi:hypothetical protein